MGKTRAQKAGALIGEGAVGCVFRPPLSCEDGRSFEPGSGQVGKVFKERFNLDDEERMMNLIKQVDPEGLFTNHAVGSCKLNRRTLNTEGREDYLKCSHIKHDEDAHQLVLKHAGKDLQNYLENEGGMDADFLKGILNLMYGVRKLQQKGMVHRDLKLPNLIYTEDRKMLMIDFGIAAIFEEVYDEEDSEFALQAEYSVFPPEFQHFYTLTSKNTEGNVNLDTWIFLTADLWNRFSKDKQFVLKQSAPKQIMHEVDSPFRVMPPGPSDSRKRSPITVSKLEGTCQLRAFEMELKTRLRHRLGKKRSVDKDTLDETYKALFDELCSKADVYSLGLCILHMLSFKAASIHLNKDTFLQLTKLALKATHFNPYARSNISEMIEAMEAIIGSERQGSKGGGTGRTPKVSPKTGLEKDINMQICSKKNTLSDLRSMGKILGIDYRQMRKEELCAALYEDLTSRSG